MNDAAGMTSGGGLTVLAKGLSTGNAVADASTGGAVDVREPTAYTDVAPTVRAEVSSTGRLDVTGSVDIKALGLGDATADADGSGGGVVSEGTSSATAKWRPTVDAMIGGGGTWITATDDVRLGAYNNYSDAGVADTSRRAQATADASGGGLASIQGAVSNAETNATVVAHVGGGATVAAGPGTDDDLEVVAKSRNKTVATSAGASGGAVSVGSSSASGTMRDVVKAITDNAPSWDRTMLSAGSGSSTGNDVRFSAESMDVADVDATAAGGGLFGGGGADATVRLISPLAQAKLGDHTTVTAPSALVALATGQSASLSSSATSTVSGAITSNDARATSKIETGQSFAEIGLAVVVEAREVSLEARTPSVYVEALSDGIVPFEVIGLDNDSTATVSVSLNPDVHVHGGGTGPGWSDRLGGERPRRRLRVLRLGAPERDGGRQHRPPRDGRRHEGRAGAVYPRRWAGHAHRLPDPGRRRR